MAAIILNTVLKPFRWLFFAGNASGNADSVLENRANTKDWLYSVGLEDEVG